ncbi:hypothetical protein F4780DRAFT_404494 [Xylariomycetidae sp. FL0641]|nr:hypothetical protein F4780DRAFT_404494 [Xylariomycetidae sp. FL0641]
MADSAPITFFDIASGPPVRPFAPNPWKTRYALNFKGLDYRTEWVELPDVASVRKRLGADPVRWHADGQAFYTLPIIRDDRTGAVVGDSMDIAVYLEKTYPDRPSLFAGATAGFHAAFNAQCNGLFPQAGLLFSERFPFNPATAAQSQREFGLRFGKAWADLVVHGDERRRVFAAFRPALDDLASFYNKYAAAAAAATGDDDGPFLNGRGVSYSEITIGGWLMMLSEVLYPEEWAELLTWHDGLWGRIHKALEPYRNKTT